MAGCGARRRRGSAVGGGGPELGGAAAGEDALAGGLAGGVQGGERLIDASGRLVAVQEVAQLGAGQAVGSVPEGGVDVGSKWVAGGLVERPGGAAGGVFAQRERRLQVPG